MTEYNTTDKIFLLSHEEAKLDGGDMTTGLWWLRYPRILWKEKAGLYDTLCIVNFGPLPPLKRRRLCPHHTFFPV